MRTTALALVPLLALSLAAAAEAPLPRAELVILPPGFTGFGISPDGSAVLGADADVGGAAAWRDGRVVALDRDPDPTLLPAIAAASSRRARVASDLGFYGASIWDDGRRIRLATDGEARGVSANGRVVVGFVEDPIYWRVAMRWIDGVAEPIRGPIGFQADWADGVSADGSVILGAGSFSGRPITPFLWRDDRVTELPGLPYRTESAVHPRGISHLKLSSDGTTAANADIVGDLACQSGCALVVEAWRWKDGRTEGLGARPGDRASLPFGISGNGEVIVGTVSGPENGRTAFVWDRAHGMRMLAELLDDLGADLQGFVIDEAWGMSDDGRRIMGPAHPAERPHASYFFLATLPPACADRIDNDGDGRVDGEDADCQGPEDPREDG